ncbi:hypothetical protein CYMTET_6243 [Cymbomonas tetramitiformis]|uniref:Potassium channel domain-containing protein n=1 Tax=Cymbomonas tetramitiformis TaxID=36881 RepID=A0AAE0LI94_9CHLO|nr:hypothetical protein CYMTET_6243 [Cymbomonas tetramitiformis]
MQDAGLTRTLLSAECRGPNEFLKLVRRIPPLTTALLKIVLFYLLGMVFYYETEGWSVFECAYFTTVTISTVGYGDISPTRDISKLFTCAYMCIVLFIGIVIGMTVLDLNWVDSTYFIFVTASTVGYGDVIPVGKSDLSKVLVSCFILILVVTLADAIHHVHTINVRRRIRLEDFHPVMETLAAASEEFEGLDGNGAVVSEADFMVSVLCSQKIVDDQVLLAIRRQYHSAFKDLTLSQQPLTRETICSFMRNNGLQDSVLEPNDFTQTGAEVLNQKIAGGKPRQAASESEFSTSSYGKVVASVWGKKKAAHKQASPDCYEANAI